MKKFKEINNASVIGLVSNIFLLVIKSIIGLITNSQSMIADAFNSASDIFSSVMSYVGNKISSIPRDEDHNLGHGKAEYIYSLFISITMAFLAIYVFKNSLTSIPNNSTYTFNIWLIIVCLITIAIKFSLYIYTNKISKKHNNLLLEATAKDHRNDCLLTVLNLVACLLSTKNVYFFDNIASIIIASCILISAIKIFKKSYDVLMDKSLNQKTKSKIYNTILNHSEIIKITNFNSSPIGYQYQISFTIHMNGNLSTFDSHKIASALEKEIKNLYPEIYLITIQVNPVYIKNQTKKRRRKLHLK